MVAQWLRRLLAPKNESFPVRRRCRLAVETLERREVLSSSVVLPQGPENPAFLTDVNGTLFFGVENDQTGFELWKSDGSAAGAERVRAFPDDKDVSGFFTTRAMVNVGGTLYFRAAEAASGAELWQSNGTEAGTTLVADIVAGSDGSNPSQLTSSGGKLFFTATHPDSGAELWISDNTGTTLVADILVGGAGSGPAHLTDVNGSLFFAARHPDAGVELFKTTGAGVTLVRDIDPEFDDNGIPVNPDSNPEHLVNVDGTLFFTAQNRDTGREVWQTVTDERGAKLAADLNPTADRGGSSFPRDLTNVNGVLYFTADDITNGQELYRLVVDSTPLRLDISPGNGSAFPPGIHYDFVTMNTGAILFPAAEDGSNMELWRTDGTPGGTSKLKDIHPPVGAFEQGSFPNHLTLVGNTLYFSAKDGSNGVELWRSNDTADGTVLDSDVNPGPGDSAPAELTRVGDRLFFTAQAGGGRGRELFIVDQGPVTRDLIINMTDAPDPVAPGATLTYTIAVQNLGTASATGVTLLSEPLPASVELDPASTAAGYTLDGQRRVGLNVGTIGAGNTFQAPNLLVKPTVDGPLEFRINATLNEVDLTPENNNATRSTQVVGVPDLIMNMTDAPDPVPVGDIIEYTITIQNIGTAAATGITLLSEPLADNVDLHETSLALGYTIDAQRRVGFAVGTIAPGGNRQAPSLRVVPRAAGPVDFRIFASLTETDATPDNNQAARSTQATGTTDFAVSLTASDPRPHVGGDFTYTLEVRNLGPSAADAAEVSFTLPAGLDLVGTPTPQPTTTAGSVLTWNVGNLAVDGRRSFAITVQPRQTGAIDALASVGIRSGVSVVDPNAGNNNANLPQTVRPSNDDFIHSFPLSGRNGTIEAVNNNATREGLIESNAPFVSDVEPLADDKPAGRSIWFEWQAGYSQFVEITTAGSNFDTLLAVYQTFNDQPGQLVRIASDDDSGGNNTSSVYFAAGKDERYYIQVDGFNGAQGSAKLNWQQQPERIPVVVPQVISSIEPQAILAGQTQGLPPLSVRGSGFTTESKVFINGLEQPTTFVSEAELRADILASVPGLLQEPGVLVAVRTGDLQSNGDILQVVRHEVRVIDANTTGTFSTPESPKGPVAGISGTVQAGPEPVTVTAGSYPLLAPLVGQDGASLIQPPGLVGQDGASLISDKGNGVVDAQIKLVGDNGSAVVANDGAGIVIPDGARIVAEHGSGVVSPNGGTLIGDNGTGFAGGRLGALHIQDVDALPRNQWFLVESSASAPSSITNTQNPDGTFTGTISVRFDDTSFPKASDLTKPLLFAVVVPPKVQFATNVISSSETAGSVTVTVTRTGGAAGEASVDYAAGAGTAVAGLDFAPVSGTLVFADGQTTRTFTIPILNDALADGARTINLTLSNPEGVLVLGTTTAALVTIDDNGPRPVAPAPPPVTPTEPPPTPVSVASVVINGGARQRSSVRTIRITFTGIVSVTPAAFEVRKRGGGVAPFSLKSRIVSGRTVVELTIRARGGLADGRYTLTVRSSQIAGLSANRTTTFFRLFGDSDGDGKLTRKDYSAFLKSLNKPRGSSAFRDFFDFNGDGKVNRTDQLKFPRQLRG